MLQHLFFLKLKAWWLTSTVCVDVSVANGWTWWRVDRSVVSNHCPLSSTTPHPARPSPVLSVWLSRTRGAAVPRVQCTAGRTQTGMELPPTADNKVQKQRLERKAKTTTRSGKLHQSMNYFLQKFASKFIKLPLKVVLSLRFNGVPRNTCLNTRGERNITNMRSVCRNS